MKEEVVLWAIGQILVAVTMTFGFKIISVIWKAYYRLHHKGNNFGQYEYPRQNNEWGVCATSRYTVFDRF